MKKIIRAIVSGILETLEERGGNHDDDHDDDHDNGHDDDHDDGHDDDHDDDHDEPLSEIEHTRKHIKKLEKDKLKQQQFYKKHVDKANYYLEFVGLLEPVEKYRNMIDAFDFEVIHTLDKILDMIASMEEKIDLFLK